MVLTSGMLLFVNEYLVLEIYSYFLHPLECMILRATHACPDSIHSFLAGDDLQTTRSSSYIILQLTLLTSCSPSRKIDLNYRKPHA